MSLRAFSIQVEQRFGELFIDFQSGLTAREDSRAFGAMIERRIIEHWEQICWSLDSNFVPNPGRRTIYDFACRHNGVFLGYDAKTKDLDSKRYSDGGVCTVGNLLKFLANDHAVVIVVEFGHNRAKLNSSLRDLEYIRVAPFHLLPQDSYTNATK